MADQKPQAQPPAEGKQGANSPPQPTRDETASQDPNAQMPEPQPVIQLEPQQIGHPDPKAIDSAGYDITQEAGAPGLKQYSGYVREEWLPQLLGRRGMMLYREMRDNDPVIGAIFFAVEMLMRGVSFHVEGGDSTPENQAAADFVESCLTDMEQSWAGFLAEIMPFLLYGWDVHEVVYKMRQGYNPRDLTKNSKYDDGMIGWRKFAGRGQETLLHWVFDESGDATHMIQLLPTGGPLLTVPLSRCLHFRTTPYKANPEGRSLIRNAYTSYYFKKRIQEIEAVGVERDLTGLPVMYVPARWTLPTASDADKAALRNAKTIVRDVRRNQQEGIVLPFMHNVDLNAKELELTLLATGGRRQFATTEIIQRYNESIAAVVLADFITLGASNGRGSYAQSKSKTDIFSLALTAILDLIVGEINRKAIPDLLRLNGMEKCEVSLKHGDIARRDLTELGTYLTDLAQAGILTPDATLEAHAREEAGLPAPDQDSMRDPTGGGDADPNKPGGIPGVDDEADDEMDAEGAAAAAAAGKPKPGAAEPGKPGQPPAPGQPPPGPNQHPTVAPYSTRPIPPNAGRKPVAKRTLPR